MGDKQYTISDLSSEFDVTTRTIRFYEEKGLLSPSRVGTSRIYTPADRTKLKLILRGKRLGFSLEESRDIIETYDPAGSNVEQLLKLRKRLEQQETAIRQQFEDLEAMMKDLVEVKKNCLRALSEAQITRTTSSKETT